MNLKKNNNNKEEEGMALPKSLPNLRVLYLWKLQELKTICSNNKVIVYDSLEIIQTYDCPKLNRLPLSLSAPS